MPSPIRGNTNDLNGGIECHGNRCRNSGTLLGFLAHEQTLNAFNEWLTRSTWNLHRQNPEVRELAGAIELALAECSNGDLSGNDLRKRLAGLIAVQRISFGDVNRPALLPLLLLWFMYGLALKQLEGNPRHHFTV